MEIKVGQIYKLSRKTANSDVFLFDQADMSTGSHLFALAEVKSADREWAKEVFSALKIFFTDLPQLTQESAMGERLAAVNYALSQVRAHSSLGNNNFSCTLIELGPHGISASSFGSAGAFLVRDGELKVIETGSEAKAGKFFANFATGELWEGDAILISTKNVFNLVSRARLEDILSSRDAAVACKELMDIAVPLAAPEDVLAGLVLSIGDRTRKPSSYGPAVNILKSIFRPTKFKLLITTAILLLIFTATVMGDSVVRHREQAEARAQAEALKKIDSDLSAAEVALIYKDYQKAVEILTRTQKIFNNIKTETLDISGQSFWRELQKKEAQLKQDLNRR